VVVKPPTTTTTTLPSLPCSLLGFWSCLAKIDYPRLAPRWYSCEAQIRAGRSPPCMQMAHRTKRPPMVARYLRALRWTRPPASCFPSAV
jgi:hypothetical protein